MIWLSVNRLPALQTVGGGIPSRRSQLSIILERGLKSQKSSPRDSSRQPTMTLSHSHRGGLVLVRYGPAAAEVSNPERGACRLHYISGRPRSCVAVADMVGHLFPVKDVPSRPTRFEVRAGCFTVAWCSCTSSALEMRRRPRHNLVYERFDRASHPYPRRGRASQAISVGDL